MRALWFFSVLLLNLSTAKAAPPLPIAFVENHGQAPVGVRFMAKGSGLTAFFAADEAVLRLMGSAVRMRFEGADRRARVEGGVKLPGHANFLIGASENWVLGSALYGSIVYRDLYPGIDMTYGANGRELKSEFLIHAGADISKIRIRYSGAGDIHVDGRGSLVIPLNGEKLREDPPVVYQEKGGRHVAVEGAFAVNDDGSVGFTIAGYDTGLPLVIDPVIKYSTLLGGSSSDAAIGVAVDSAGAAYIAGYTASYDFPMQNPVQNLKSGSNDVFIAKLNSSGTGLVYSTYLGGSGDDQANGIAVDGAGSVYVTGSTTSTNFPMRNALQARLAGQKNAFALKLSPAGNSLVYSTYLGGNGSDSGNGIAVDTTGNAYVVGDTSSITFPATGVQKGNRGSQDAFVAKLSTDGSRLVYSTYLGGSNVDHGAAIAVDASGAAYITGSTYSTDFPTASPFQVSNGGGQDAFVAKLSADGSSLVYSTYLGGSGGSLSYPEQGQGIAVDAQGNAYITGATSSANFPVMLPFQSTLDGWEDAFLAKLNPTGWPVYSTYLGGSGVDCANAIAVDATGSVYIVGYTYSTDLPVVNALQPSIATAGNMDAFVAVLAPSGNSLSYLSYLGGTGSDTATSVALDSVGGVYVAGWTLSANFPLAGSLQSVNGGNYGAFVMKMRLSAAAPPVLSIACTHAANFTQGQSGGYTLTVQNAVSAGPTNGMVTVTETLPSGLTMASMNGVGWTCSGVSCTRSDLLNGGGSYQPITVVVNVAGSTSPQVNTVNVTGGGSADAGTTDSTTITVANTATSIWTVSDAPSVIYPSAEAMNAGLKLRSDVPGWVTGIRFFKGAANTGAYVVTLYSGNGAQLAQAMFTGNPTASGWQQVNFAAPVAITANTTYVAAYFSTSGFAYTGSYFTKSGVDSAPLHALRSGVDGVNGLYLYGAAPQFPSLCYVNSNYWVDVAFSAGSGVAPAPDLTIASSHSGSFTQGQSGASYTITASNGGTGPTSGTVTVTETLPIGLTATSIAGANWSCTQPSGPCTRSDALVAGSSYPAITLTVNVAGNAAASVTNTANISGGGEVNAANDQAADPTTISSAGVGGTETSIWASTVVPGAAWHVDTSMTAGLKFRSDVAGTITGIRYYRGLGNNGTHVGLLYSGSGTLLAQAAFTGESASGWQQVHFSTPVAISAGTTYVAAFFSTTGYAWDGGYFSGSGVDNAPLHAPQSGVGGSNGLYIYGSTAQFPTATYNASNYWVDVAFSAGSGVAPAPDLTIASSHSGSFTQGQSGASYTITASNGGTGPTSGTITVTETLPIGLTATSIAGANWNCMQPSGPCTRSDALVAGSSYPAITLTVNVAGNAATSVTNTASISGGGEINSANDQATDPTTISSGGGEGTETSIWASTVVPGTAWHVDTSMTAGLKFRSDVAGTITGIRYYRGLGNNGTHVGLLYSGSGTLLAQATFTGESASGWQQVHFSTPVAISAGTTYVAAFFSTTGFAWDGGYFSGNGVDDAPLHALQSGVDGSNGLYIYGSSAQFPSASYNASNYWVDVLFK